MVSLMLWDGSHVAEVVAFGASINQRLLAIRPGDGLAMTGVELGGGQASFNFALTTEKLGSKPSLIAEHDPRVSSKVWPTCGVHARSNGESSDR